MSVRSCIYSLYVHCLVTCLHAQILMCNENHLNYDPLGLQNKELLCMREIYFNESLVFTPSLFTSLLQQLARGGVTVSATFNYQLNPQMGTNFCVIGGSVKVQNCLEIYHGWPRNYVTIDTWYQLRSVKKCCTKIWKKKACVVSLLIKDEIGCTSMWGMNAFVASSAILSYHKYSSYN